MYWRIFCVFSDGVTIVFLWLDSIGSACLEVCVGSERELSEEWQKREAG